MIQLTLIKIEGYGPWTLTLGSDREHELQILQSRLYSDIQRLFSKNKGLVFFNRFDEMFAVTNGIDLDKHSEILNMIKSSYGDLNVKMYIGKGETPYKAQLDAIRSKNNVIYEKDSGYVQILHIDVDNSTSTMSDRLSPYELSSLIFRLYSRLIDEFLKYEALTFFLGGDNFMVLSNSMKKDDVLAVIEPVSRDLGIALKCGIGKARNAREAASMATNALDTIRSLRKVGIIERVYEVSCI